MGETVTALIEIQNVSKHFGDFVAVDGVSFSVAAGSVLGFLGPNGAGKSTTMKMIAGFLSPSAGTVRVAGHDVVKDPLAAKRRIGYLPEGNPLYLDMRLREALKFTASARGLAGDERRKAIGAALDDAGLLGREHQIIASLSRGYRQRVGLAMALLHRPPILILDEPTSGLDPNQQTEMRKFIRSLAEKHTIVFSSHILPEVEAVCDRVIAIHRGQVVADGTVEEVRAQAQDRATVGVVVRAELATARAAFDALPQGQIISCAVEAVNPTLTRLAVRVGGGNDLEAREAIAKCAYEAGLGLVHLALERASLEEAFAVLTPDHGDDIGPAGTDDEEGTDDVA